VLGTAFCGAAGRAAPERWSPPGCCLAGWFQSARTAFLEHLSMVIGTPPVGLRLELTALIQYRFQDQTNYTTIGGTSRLTPAVAQGTPFA
jgi:hypothetical protein